MSPRRQRGEGNEHGRPPLPTTEGWHRDPDGLVYWINDRGRIEPGSRHYPDGEPQDA